MNERNHGNLERAASRAVEIPADAQAATERLLAALRGGLRRTADEVADRAEDLASDVEGY